MASVDGKGNKGLDQIEEKQGLVSWWIFGKSDGPVLRKELPTDRFEL